LACAGVALLHAGLHPNSQKLLRFLYRCGFLKLLVAPHSLCWDLSTERAPLIVIASPTVFDSNERRFVDMETGEIFQILTFAGRDDVDKQAHVGLFFLRIIF
jgi:pre-mRNA-splicing helicase BRR2